MSSESAYFDVIENQRQIERARAEAWQEVQMVEGRLQSLCERLRSVEQEYRLADTTSIRSLPRRPAESCGLDEIEAHIAILRDHCIAVDNEIARSVAAAETRLLLDEISKYTAGTIIPTDELFSLATHSVNSDEKLATPSGTASETDLRAREVAGILARLSGHIPRAERVGLKRLATAVLRERESGRAKTLALELRLRAQTANEKAERAVRDAQRAADLRAALWGLVGDDVRSVAAECTTVERQEAPLSPTLIKRVEEVVRAARARANRAYAAEVIKEELQRLGYEVEEGFDSLFIEGGQALVRSPGLEDYRVLMGAEATSDRLDVQLARFGRKGEAVSQQQALRDRETEDKWCKDFAQMRQALDQRRIATRLLRRVPAGAQPICILDRADTHIRRRHEGPMAKRQT